MLLNIIPNYIEPILKYYFRDFIFTFKFQKKKKKKLAVIKMRILIFFWEEKICLLWDILKFSFLTQLTFLV